MRVRLDHLSGNKMERDNLDKFIDILSTKLFMDINYPRLV